MPTRVILSWAVEATSGTKFNRSYCLISYRDKLRGFSEAVDYSYARRTRSQPSPLQHPSVSNNTKPGASLFWYGIDRFLLIKLLPMETKRLPDSFRYRVCGNDGHEGTR